MRKIKCKDCGDLMSQKDVKGVEIDECLKCGDVWFDAGEIEKYLSKTGKDVGLVAKLKNKKTDDLEAEVCISCNIKTFYNFGSDNSFFGFCKNCDGFYLNHSFIESHKGDLLATNQSFGGFALEVLIEGVFHVLSEL